MGCYLSIVCLVSFAFAVHPTYPLIILSNRDEFWDRPSLAVQTWKGTILAPRDGKAHGTWIGANSTGRVSFLTNVRNFKKDPHPNPKSRGALVWDFLESPNSYDAYTKKVFEEQAMYEGFNLFCYEGKKAVVLGGEKFDRRVLEPGIYGVSNASLDTPWPKLEKIKSLFVKSLESLPLDPNDVGSLDIWISKALDLLADGEQVTDVNRLPDTGIGVEKEKFLSSIRIQLPGYGTRTSSLLLLRDSEVRFWERTYADPFASTYQTAEASLPWKALS